jgi:hypothetical protein
MQFLRKTITAMSPAFILVSVLGGIIPVQSDGIAGVRILNYPLSAAQLAAIYNAGVK